MAKRKRILYTGASGKLAGTLVPKLAKTHEIVAVVNTGTLTCPSCEVVNHNLLATDVTQLLSCHQPDIVINTAALSTDKQCFDQPETARTLNTRLPAELALGCQQRDIRLIQFSTDQVYDGRAGNYREHDPALPVNCYGDTKRAAEQTILDNTDNAIILRLALTYGLATGKKLPFSHSLINQLANADNVKLFTDEYRSILYIPDLARLLAALCDESRETAAGIYNAGGPQRINRFEFGEQICRQFGFSRDLLIPVKASEMSFAEPRPADCSMNSEKLNNAMAWQALSIEQGIADMHRQYHAGH